MVNPVNVQAKVKKKLETVSYWSDRTSRALGLIILSVSNSTPPPAPFTLQDWSNILQSIQTSSSNVNYIEDTVAKTIYDIIIRVEKGWRAEDATATKNATIQKFMDDVHAYNKTGVESGGTASYTGSRRTMAQNIMMGLKDGKEAAVKLLIPTNPLIPEANAQAAWKLAIYNNLLKFWQTPNINALGDIILGIINISYPYQQVVVNDGYIPPGDDYKTWTRAQLEAKLKELNDWMGSYTDSVIPVLRSVAHPIEAAGKAKEILAIEAEIAWRKLNNLWDDIKDAGGNALGLLGDAASNAASGIMTEIQKLIMDTVKALIPFIVGAAVIITCVIVGVWLIKKYAWTGSEGEKLLKDAQDKVHEGLEKVQSKVEERWAKMEALNDKMQEMATKQMMQNMEMGMDPIGGTFKKTAQIVQGAKNTVDPALQIIQENPELAKMAMTAGMGAATGGTSMIGPAMAQAAPAMMNAAQPAASQKVVVEV